MAKTARNVARRIALRGEITLTVGRAHLIGIEANFHHSKLPLFTIWHSHESTVTHWKRGEERPLDPSDIVAFRRWLKQREVPVSTIRDSANTLSHIMRMWRGQK